MAYPQTSLVTSAQASRTPLWKWKTLTILPVAAWLHLSACTSHKLLKRLQPLPDITNPHPAGTREQTKKNTHISILFSVLLQSLLRHKDTRHEQGSMCNANPLPLSPHSLLTFQRCSPDLSRLVCACSAAATGTWKTAATRD